LIHFRSKFWLEIPGSETLSSILETPLDAIDDWKLYHAAFVPKTSSEVLEMPILIPPRLRSYQRRGCSLFTAAELLPASNS
jgi:hypothetical protein